MGIFGKCKSVKKYLKLLVFLAVCLGSQLTAGTVRLLNDSPYRLRAVVRGADGSYLGEMVLNAQGFTTWTDANTRFGVFGKGNPFSQGPAMPQAPYAVLWYCLDGSDYSVCSYVPNGATVNAQGCDGARICKPVPKKKNTNPNEAVGEELTTPPNTDHAEDNQ